MLENRRLSRISFGSKDNQHYNASSKSVQLLHSAAEKSPYCGWVLVLLVVGESDHYAELDQARVRVACEQRNHSLNFQQLNVESQLRVRWNSR